MPPPSCKKQPLQNKQQKANHKRPTGEGVHVSCAGDYLSSENAKNYKTNGRRSRGIRCGFRFGSRARTIIYVYYPLDTIF